MTTEAAMNEDQHCGMLEDLPSWRREKAAPPKAPGRSCLACQAESEQRTEEGSLRTSSRRR